MAREEGWERSREPIRIWEHRGKVCLVGRGHSPTDRRWDGVSMDRTLGAFEVIAAKEAMEDAGISPDEVDGIITSAGGQPNGGPFGALWAPRPYFAPPYDSEDGLSHVTGQWLARELGLKNARFMYSRGSTIWDLMALAAQCVGDGRCSVCLVTYPNGNMEGRYHQNPDIRVRGGAQWSNPWGWGLSGQGFQFLQYCRKYGSNHDRMAPFIVQEHKNGVLWPPSYYAQHERQPFTVEDYVNGRWIAEGLSIFDCDRPVQAAACYVMTTAERARNMKQRPVYILDHTTTVAPARSLIQTMEEAEEATDTMARKAYAGSGLRPGDIDVFQPYDGFAVFTQYFLEAFRWRGVKRGEAHDFYAEDITPQGPNPFCTGGGNMGSGRMRTAYFSDGMEQIQQRAGPRQARRADTMVTIGVTPGLSSTIVMSSTPD